MTHRRTRSQARFTRDVRAAPTATLVRSDLRSDLRSDFLDLSALFRTQRLDLLAVLLGEFVDVVL